MLWVFATSSITVQKITTWLRIAGLFLQISVSARKLKGGGEVRIEEPLNLEVISSITKL